MSEASGSQAAPAADSGRKCRKCFDGYYRMMTTGEWTDHLIEYEEEYEASRLAIAERGSSVYPDLTEEEDRARFTDEELLMEEEDRNKAHADLTGREKEAREAREAAE